MWEEMSPYFWAGLVSLVVMFFAPPLGFLGVVGTVAAGGYRFIYLPFKEEQDRAIAAQEKYDREQDWPSVDRFESELRRLKLSTGHPLTDDLIEPAVRALIEFYERQFAKRGRSETAAAEYEQLRGMCRESLVRYAAALQDMGEQIGPAISPFRARLSDLVGYGKRIKAIDELAAPFRTGGAAEKITHSMLYESSHYRLYSLDLRNDGTRYVTEKEFQAVQKKLIADYGEWHAKLITAFDATPFFTARNAMISNIQEAYAPEPIDFREIRFQGQWVLGDSGTGKTTFLSNLIAYDFAKVEKGEASIVVIDSQNELIPQIGRLAIFGPGGTLEGRLIHLEPDPEFPLALNIFDTQTGRFSGLSATDKEILSGGAIQLVRFFLTSIMKAEMTSHMDTVLEHLIRATLSIQDATILTMQELVEPDGYDKLKGRLRIPADEHRWFQTRLYGPDYKQTLGALRARLDGFTANAFFKRMFVNPRNRLDLFTELQAGKVILINTNKGLLKGATELLGRFFIAKLLQATEERMLIDKADRLPVYVYIDEATDYIAEEENIAELINKARKQKVAMVFAAQSESDIRSPRVLAALQRTGIRDVLTAKGWAKRTFSYGYSCEVKVPPADFSRLPQMSSKDQVNLRNAMRYWYTTPHFEPDDEEIVEEDEIRPS